MLVDLRHQPLTADEALNHVRAPAAGAIDLFFGVVRNHHQGQAVLRLEYQAYPALALVELQRIASEVERRFGARVAALHRLGLLEIGETAVICAASASHRAEAFAACRALIDGIKATVPIWKREHRADGQRWQEGC